MDMASHSGEAARRTALDPRAPIAACLVLAVLAVVQVLIQSRTAIQEPSPLLAMIALACTVPLGLLWSQPRMAGIVTGVACLLSLKVPGGFSLAGAAAMLLMAWRLGNRGFQALAGCIAAVFGLVALLSSAAAGQNRQAVIVLAVAVPLAGWAGYARRTHAESQARDEATEAIAGSLLEHTARGERARISRELHDVVAHHISMIAVQAETARLATPGMPEAGAERLSAIGDTARAALTEMRRLLGVLREDTEIASPVRQPQPGLDQLAELVDQARDAAGVGARLIISGSPTRLDPGVELAAYRIVQEALTNARRHAPGAAVDVELRYHGSGLYLRVRDNGPGLAAAASPAETGAEGHGLLGMRERATAVGGRLQAGPAPGGGFMIEVSLPAEAEEDAA
ncbi:MAG TPA: sensor histidine kinase [Streptosporangiaceae bacterium]